MSFDVPGKNLAEAMNARPRKPRASKGSTPEGALPGRLF